VGLNVPAPKIRDGQSVAALYDCLRTAIQRGELEPGGSVSQAHLARTFGAGRTPLREALRMLQPQRLVIAADRWVRPTLHDARSTVHPTMPIDAVT